MLVLFREGTGGNFFKTLFKNQDLGEPGSRIDRYIKNPRLEFIETESNHLSYTIRIAHIDVSDEHKKHHEVDVNDFDIVVRILPHQKIFKAIWNNFHKKILVEENLSLDSWQDDVVYWFDKCYYNIKQYYQLHKLDIINNTIIDIINFDQIEDIDYLREISKKYFLRDLTNDQIRFIQSYKSKQLGIDITDDLEKDMSKIVAEIPDERFLKDPWFASYCVFKYEKNNGFDESDRIWSIEEFKDCIEVEHLLDIANRYQDHST